MNRLTSAGKLSLAALLVALPLCALAQDAPSQQNPAPLPNAPAPPPFGLLQGAQGISGMQQIPPPPPPPADPRRNPPAKPGALTMEQVIALARNSNPALLAARQNLEATRAQEIQAGVRQNPQLTVAGNDVTLSSKSGEPAFISYQASRLFERGQKRRRRLDVARSTTLQTEDQLHDQERGTVLAVKQAFTNMLIAKAAPALSTANLADYRRELAVNLDRFKAGDIGKIDYERLDLQLAQFENDQTAAETNLRQASDQLQTLIGIENPKVDFDIDGQVVPPSLPFDIAALDAKALAARPDYQAAIAGVAVADANVKLAYANGTTDPTLEGEYDRVADYNSAGFNLSIPLRIFDRNQGNKKTSEFSAQSAVHRCSREEPGLLRCRSGLDWLYPSQDSVGSIHGPLSR
jgi:cobalt-zinc-cadmium efflux system outer membrane protein